MEGARNKRKDAVRITQAFEASRLEKSLLAVAYERAVPVTRNTAASPQSVAFTSKCSSTNGQVTVASEFEQSIAMGGLVG